MIKEYISEDKKIIKLLTTSLMSMNHNPKIFFEMDNRENDLRILRIGRVVNHLIANGKIYREYNPVLHILNNKRAKILEYKGETNMASTETKVQYEIKNLEVKTTKGGKPFASFQLDDTEELKNCVMWDKDYERLKDKVKNGNIVAGVVWAYNKEFNNYNVTDIGTLVAECKDGLTEVEASEILSEIVDAISNADIDISGFLSENAAELIVMPAARKHHHPYKGGLMQHTKEVMDKAEADCEFYGIDKDRKINILAACALHDLYKVKEYTFDGISASNVDEFYKMETSHTLAMYAEINNQNSAVANLIATHHGRKDWGALRDAESIDELIVHYADMLSSRGGKITAKDL